MRTPHFHLPRLRGPAAHHPHTGEGHRHHPSLDERMGSVERVIDFLVLALILGLGGAMAYGLINASGDAGWFQ